MSIHCNANIGDIEKTVLMPGDPLRAKYIAENFLENAKLVNTVRNMLAYTGTYKGKKVTVFSSGMGMPSMGIYSYELFKFYGVERIIRIGSCGAYNEDLNLFDTILVDKSYTEANFAHSWDEQDCHIAEASNECFDGYLDDIESFINRFPKDLNIIACEMEAFALFYMAKYFGKEASCLLTVVDSHYKNQESTSEEREKSLNNMIKLALESI